MRHGAEPAIPFPEPDPEARGGRAGPEWPSRLTRIARTLRDSPSSGTERLRGELWALLVAALRTRIRAESRRLGSISPEDLADLAAERALELFTRIDQGRWDLAGSHPAAVASFVGTVARNGMIDRLRRRSRRRETHFEEEEPETRAAPGSPVETPELAVARREFVDGLTRCLQLLRPKHRRIWLWRVLLELPTRVVASQPDVQLRGGHVDVIQQRTRKLMGDCMKARGFHPFEVPAGTLAELWSRFRWTGTEGER